MAGDSKIQWTQKTWNPVAGCSVLSPGCTNCYAMKMAARLDAMGVAAYAGLTRKTKAGAVWTGEMRLVESALTQPLRWKKPALIFVNSMSDLFHESVPDAWIDQVFAVMALSPHHTFQVLTKRAERMRAYLSEHPDVLRDRWFRAVPSGKWPVSVNHAYAAIHPHASEEHRKLYHAPPPAWPLPNVWLGVSAEDQPRADDRTPELLATPAAVRFLSAEPLLGPIDLTWIPSPVVESEDEGYYHSALERSDSHYREGHPDVLTGRGIIDATDGPMMERLDWVIVGGESGPGARPMHPDWARQIRDDCAAAGVPFFFKQWGAWTPGEYTGPVRCSRTGAWLYDSGWSYTLCSRAGAEGFTADEKPALWRVGKKAAGRLLDGVEHNAMPGARA